MNNNMPYLVFSCQAANKVCFNNNPLGWNSQITSKGYNSWVNEPEGCVNLSDLARMAPGCGILYDRAFGVHAAGYYIGDYADQPGRRCECFPALPGDTYVNNPIDFKDVLSSIGDINKRISWKGVFIGSPKMITESSSLNTPLDKTKELSRILSYFVQLFEKDIIPIFDTGGVVSSSSDAYVFFNMLKSFNVPFLLEPTRPLGSDAEKTIATSSGLVSLYDVYNAIALDKNRQWSTDEWLANKGQFGVMWCSGGTPEVNFQRALKRLQNKGKVIVSLRGLSQDQILQLHQAREAIEGSYRDENFSQTKEAAQVDYQKSQSASFDKNKFKLK